MYICPVRGRLPAAAGPDHETAETHIPAANPAAALRRSGRVVRLRAERNAVAVGQTGPHDRQPAGLRLPEGAAYRRTAASVERERPDSRPGVRDQRQAVRRIPQVQTRLGHPLHGAQRPAGAPSGRPPQGLSFGNPPGGTLLVDGHVHRGEADAGLDRPPVGAPRHAGDLLQGLQPFLPAIRGFQRTETLPRAGGTLSGFGDHVCRHGFGALQARPALPDEPPQPVARNGGPAARVSEQPRTRFAALRRVRLFGGQFLPPPRGRLAGAEVLHAVGDDRHPELHEGERRLPGARDALLPPRRSFPCVPLHAGGRRGRAFLQRAVPHGPDVGTLFDHHCLAPGQRVPHQTQAAILSGVDQRAVGGAGAAVRLPVQAASQGLPHQGGAFADQCEAGPAQRGAGREERAAVGLQCRQGAVHRAVLRPLLHVHRQNGRLPQVAQEAGPGPEVRRTQQTAQIDLDARGRADRAQAGGPAEQGAADLRPAASGHHRQREDRFVPALFAFDRL